MASLREEEDLKLVVEEDVGAPFRYWVISEEDPRNRYLVDLTARDGHGACQCIHFETVCDPNLREIGDRVSYRRKDPWVTECKHIAAALQHFHLHVTMPMLSKFQHGICQ